MRLFILRSDISHSISLGYNGALLHMIRFGGIEGRNVFSFLFRPINLLMLVNEPVCPSAFVIVIELLFCCTLLEVHS